MGLVVLAILVALGVAFGQPHGVEVPFVGCKSDGHSGPGQEPPTRRIVVNLPAQVAAKLAFYQAAGTVGVFAPRGWKCHCFNASSGETLLVSEVPIDEMAIPTGKAIEVIRRYGDNSGRLLIGEIIGITFPAFQWFVNDMRGRFEEVVDGFRSKPFPEDRLTYPNSRTARFTTAAQQTGLGNMRGWLGVSDRQIDGVALLFGQTPNLLRLSLRLGPAQSDLVEAIRSQFEHQAEKLEN